MGDVGNMNIQMLLDLVGAHDTFHEKCQLHEKPRNLYCFDCRLTPICALCKPAHNHEPAAHIIQVSRNRPAIHLNPRKHYNNGVLWSSIPSRKVFKATRKKAVLEESIAGLIDTSDIQKLINNGTSVVYIKRRREAGAPGHIIEHHACRTCRFIFPLSTKDPRIRFCSIGCKVSDADALGSSAWWSFSARGVKPFRPRLFFFLRQLLVLVPLFTGFTDRDRRPYEDLDWLRQMNSQLQFSCLRPPIWVVRLRCTDRFNCYPS
ncbi:hypothetical protein BHM03_00052973 [Ensete ventricosum]|nr:hypothetical protein BHM03_00052973 [Ensete ventricosum]